ncbi:N-acetylmuramoyl-L-alanine amidase [Desulfuromonas acetoxidans]|uniref:N-acetylmuramoyl-L-alanine amidase n=1 Tax=Desulfuromonas acetoxidans TaxID=891 RepID=UPI00292FBE0E|nr:N-acetylmuramoyl-L-alanine amidase [Desulfuromonas acetoxidans]
MLRLSRIFLILLFVFFAVSSVSQASVLQDYRDARYAYQQLLRAPQKQQYRHHWNKVFTRLQHFVDQHPDHEKAPGAYYLLGQSHEKLYEISRVKKDARAAVDYYQSLARRYPSSSLADDALLFSARLQCEVLGAEQAARNDCQVILQRYPSGDMHKRARELLATLPPSTTPVPVKVTTSQPAVSPGPHVVSAIRHWQDADHTRLVLDLDGIPVYRVNTLPPSQKDNTSARLYIDLFKTNRVSTLSSNQKIGGTLVKSIRVGETEERTRIVFDLAQLTRYKVITLAGPPRIVIDLANHVGATLKEDVPQLETSTDAVKGDSGSDQISQVLQRVPADETPQIHLPDVAAKTHGKLRIVVDAGHGGKDPGAIGPGKLYEKDVVLKLAKTLAQRLESSFHCEVLLTRDRDIYIPLLERTAYANEVDADLFISIHANASVNKKAYGIETFYLNFSKTDKAMAVAARENGMSLQEVGDLELILFDMMANSKINESSRLAAEIQSSLVGQLSRKYSNVKDLGVRQGPFHVLLGATMPSVLVEVAFISHSREAKRLNSRTYRERSAEAIVHGVRQYLQSQNLLAKRASDS